MTLLENAAQISGQDILQKAFQEMTGSPLTSAHRLRDGAQNLILMEIKS